MMNIGCCCRIQKLFWMLLLFVLPFSMAFVVPSTTHFISGGSLQQQQQQRHLLKMVVDVQELEQMAIEASEQWDVSVTPFLTMEEMRDLQQRLDPQADVGYVLAMTPQPNPSRNRLILTHSDNIPMISSEDYCVLLQIDGASSSVPIQSWPRILKNIGIDLCQVGDLWTSADVTYLVVSPSVVKQCVRLLPKELKRLRGLTISVVDPEDYIHVDFLDEDESYPQMELGKLDQRSLKYKEQQTLSR